MKKIKTIFNRNWEGDKTVVDNFVEGVSSEILSARFLPKNWME